MSEQIYLVLCLVVAPLVSVIVFLTVTLYNTDKAYKLVYDWAKNNAKKEKIEAILQELKNGKN